ncbi:MAG: phosphatidylglycerophosphatase A [bacterium]|nr:phosphatidylglycerophosphatase A [bacterium]
MNFRIKKPQQLQPLQTPSDYLAAIFSSLGVGYLPWASGTLGSLLALILWIPFASQPFSVRVFALLLVIIFGTLAAHRAIRFWGEDPSQVIIDEVGGMWLTLLFVSGQPICFWLLDFILFRWFDVWKPPPIRELEQLRGGIGIMIDDLVAGLYALIVSTFIQIILRGLALL